MPSYYCSTTEGEPELHPKQEASILHLQPDILHLYTGAMMRDHAVEQYHMVYLEWYGSVLNQPRGECPVSFMQSLKGKNEPHLKYAYHHSCLVSDYIILLSLYCSTHVSSSQYKNVFTIQNYAWEDQRQI